MPGPDLLLVLVVLAGTLVLFVGGWVRLDVAAMLSLLALALSGVLTPGEALAGFADPVVLMIAGLFVVGDGLFQTGVAAGMGQVVGRVAGQGQTRLLLVIMLMVALLSGFMSSTGTVAVMLPVVAGLAWDRGLSPSKLLIPLAIASLLGGMLTLIGTAPNIVVSNQLAAEGLEPFGFFAFTPVGLVMVVVGVLFMALWGRRLLPDREAPGRPEDLSELPTVAELAQSYRVASLLVRVPDGSTLEGVSLREASLPERFGVTVTQILPVEDERGPRVPGARTGLRRRRPTRPRTVPPASGTVPPGSSTAPPGSGTVHPGSGTVPPGSSTLLPGPDTVLQGGDRLQVRAPAERAARFLRETGVELLPDEAGALVGNQIGMAEVLLTPRSRLLGRTLVEIGFRERYRVTALAIRRMGAPLPDDPRETTLRFGDTILVKGPWSAIRLLAKESRDFVVVAEPREMHDALRPLARAPLALGVMGGMMLLMTTGLTAPVLAVLLAAVAMVVTRCVTVEDAYRSINWESVVLIAAVLPMATALEKTGAMALAVEGLGAVLADAGPRTLMAAMFVLTCTLSQVISNTATTVLVAPLAFGLAMAAGVAPEPILMSVAVAASAAFATPMATPVNTLVLGPGGYRFGDFFRIGSILQAVILVATLLVVPLVFPF